MNKDNAKDYLPLVQALADGKVIQVRNSTGWAELKNYDFTSPADHYRIKPEPREIWVNHYDQGLKLDQVCDSQDEADRRVHEGYGLVQKHYREVIE